MGTRQVIRIFLGSPGDLTSERQAAKSVCDEFNALWGDELGFHIDLVGWEDTVAAFGRAQDLINRDLQTCEYFIGVVWKRWGTPPSLTGKFSSGFEEEYALSIERREKGDEIEISLFLKDIDDDAKRDPGDQLKSVLQFREALVSEKKIYFETFCDISEFSNKLRRLITKYVQRKRELAHVAGTKDQPKNINSAERGVKLDHASDELESIDHALDRLSQERNNLQLSLDATQVARSRLIASVLYTSSNDRQYVQVHDSNLLFQARSTLKQTVEEDYALLIAGLRGIDDEVQPIWYWYRRSNRKTDTDILLTISTDAPSKQAKQGALKAARLLAIRPPSDTDKREALKARWSSLSATVVSSALDYISQVGNEQDLEWIRAEYNKGNSTVQPSAVNALFAILAKQSLDSALQELIILQPTNVPANCVSALVEGKSAITDQTIKAGLSHRSQQPRRAMAEIAVSRGLINEEDALELLNHEDYGIRFNAAISLLACGKPLSTKIISEALTQPKRSGSLFAIGGNEQEWTKKYEKARYEYMSEEDLVEAAATESMYEVDAFNALLRLDFAKYRSEAKSRLDNRYKARFAKHLEELGRMALGGQLRDQASSIESFVTSRHTNATLQVVFAKGDGDDLQMVRSLAEGDDLKSSATLFDYFAEFGSKQDIPLMLRAIDRIEIDYTLPERERYRLQTLTSAAKALLAIIGDDPGQILSLADKSGFFSVLIALLPKKTFLKIDNEGLTKLLNLDHDDIRKAVALKILAYASVKRVQDIIDALMAQGKYYYNVMFWLDAKKSLGSRAAIMAGHVIASMKQD